MVVSSPQCGEKYSLFLRFSSWRNTGLRHFVGYPCGTSRKKASTIFYNTAFKNMFPAHGIYPRPFGATDSPCIALPLFFQPLDVVPAFFSSHGNMKRGDTGRGSVPVFDTRRKQDHIAGANLLSRPSLLPADSSRNDQSLPQRMAMPCSTGSRLKGGICA